MPLFVMTGLDKPDGLEIRKATRPAHLDWIEALGERVKLAGPFIDDSGSPVGSLIMLDADDIKHARSLFAEDPYTLAGLWADQTIRSFTQVKP